MPRNKNNTTSRGRATIPGPVGTAPVDSADQPAEDPESPQEATKIDRSEHFATQLRHAALPLFLNAGLAKALPQVDLLAYQIYRDRLLTDCGSPTDPIEVMLIEQLVLAHMNTGLLHNRASNANTIETAAVYLSAAARLTGEFRRTALALQAYRAASVRLAEMAESDLDVPAGEIAEPANALEENHITTEIEATLSADHNEPPSLPFRRSATI
jgi:hypothetical protein